MASPICCAQGPAHAAQLHSRAAFGAASNAWSESQRLTEEEREAWRAAGAKVQSRLRLYQQGPLTGQQFFVGRNCARDQIGGKMRWELAEPKEESAGARRQDAEFASQVAQPQTVARPTWDRYRSGAGVVPGQCRWTAGCSRGIGAIVSGQSRASLADFPRNRHWRELWRGG